MNLNYKDWYLVEVYSRLNSAYGAERAANTLSEISEHYDALVEEGISKGLPEIIANQAAANRLGEPQKLAQVFLQHGTSRANFSWSLVAFLAIIACAPFAWNQNVPVSSTLSALILVTPILAGILTRRALNYRMLFAACVLLFAGALYVRGCNVYLTFHGETSYGQAHSSYKQLVQQHREALLVESQAAANWRETLKKPFKDQHTIARVTYEDLGESFLIASPNRKQVSFQFSPIQNAGTVFVLHGKLSSEIEGRLAEVHQHQAERIDVLNELRMRLNDSIISRVSYSWIPSALSSIGIFAYVFLTSLLWAKMTTAFRTRRSKLFA